MLHNAQYIVAKTGSLKANLHGTTLSHTTSLRQAYDMNCFGVNQTYNSLITVVYIKKNVVGF